MKKSFIQRLKDMRLVQGCPDATQDVGLNLKNRGIAVDTAWYGPLNPNEPNDDYWQNKADHFNTTIEEAKSARCGNCIFFIQTPQMLECIASGIGKEASVDPYDSIDAGDLGYCDVFDFKCAGSRTCDAWAAGGPIR